MKQQTLAMATDQNAQYEQYRRPTRRDAFLATMEQIVPWSQLCEVIEPHYPKVGNGRPPVGLERMLRMYFVQQWFNLADAACDDALLDSTALRRFVGIDLGRERVPDATTLLKFRRLLEKNKLGEALFAKVGEVLQARGLKVGVGTIVDATIIGAPSSTKNKEGKRDPEMHQTRKGKQYFFGMKCGRPHLIPKCQALPFFVWCISGSRALPSFLVELGAAMMVASTMVPARIRRPCSARWALISSNRALVRSLSSSRRLNFSSVVASGTDSRDRSMPTKSRGAWLSYSASSSASSARPYHCCRQYMRSIRGTPIGCRPTRPRVG